MNIGFLFIMIPVAMPLSAIFTYIACRVFNALIAPFRAKKIIAKNNVIEAKYDKMTIGGDVSAEDTFRYVFYVNGKKHIRMITTNIHNATPTIKLYYNRDPKRAHIESHAGCIESEWKGMFVVHTIIIAIVLCLFFSKYAGM